MTNWKRAAALIAFAAAASTSHAQKAPVSGGASANIMLCDTPEHAIAYTVAINGGAPEEMAKDMVGKAAGAEVCDKFIGHATIDVEKTVSDKGLSYLVTAYKFKGVGVMKWSAIPKD